MRTLLLALMFAVGCGANDDDDSRPDAETVDSGVLDSGAADAGAPDTGAVVDAGIEDTGAIDTGLPDAGMTETWSTGISDLFTTYCVQCHDTGNANRDYNLYAEAFRDRDEIRCGIAPSSMRPAGCVGFPPPGQFPVGNGPFPTDEERTRVVSWIEAGAPED